MNNRRIELHELLINLLGSPNVYFQPPATDKMQYPCIVYARDKLQITHADDLPYNHKTGYTVTVIDPNPDSVIPNKFGKLPLCKFNRRYTADNLNHDVFSVYY